MLYALKYVGNGTGDFLEYGYDEVITVKSGIALCQFEHNRDMLLGMNFVELGMIENEGNLKDLLKDKSTELHTYKKVVALSDILPEVGENKASIEGAQKSWYENIE